MRELESVLRQIEEPVDEFDDELFKNTVVSIKIDERENAEFELKGGFRFIEQL